MLSELFQTGILVALVTFTCTRIAARMENTSTLRPFLNTDWDFKDYIKNFDASAVRDRIEKMRKAKGFNVTTQEYISSMFDGMDAAEELLKLQVKAGDVRLLLDKDGRRWEPPPGFTEEQNDRFNLRPRIFELMKQAIYQARNKMVMMQILRKKYSGSSLYKMGYLFSKTDTACKTFAQFAYRAIRHCGLGKTSQTERVYLIDVLEIEERLVNLWFTVELLVDLIVKNDILCKGFPGSLALFSLYPSELPYLMYGDLTSNDDLFLPEDDNTTAESKNSNKQQIVASSVPLEILLQDVYNIFKINDLEKVFSDNLTTSKHDIIDEKEFNDLSSEIFNARRAKKSDWLWQYDSDDNQFYHYFDWWTRGYLEDVKKKSLSTVGIQFLIHARYMINKALEQRSKIRTDKRYKLGYLFNRVRRLKTEMLKVVTHAHKQETQHYTRGLMPLLRLYEQTARYDVDLRDTIRLIRALHSEAAPSDFVIITSSTSRTRAPTEPVYKDDPKNENYNYYQG